jgi:hypothetical protein
MIVPPPSLNYLASRAPAVVLQTARIILITSSSSPFRSFMSWLPGMVHIVLVHTPLLLLAL